VFDFGQSCDVNGVSMTVSNVGSFAFPGSLLTGGFEFPKGSGKTAVFEAGLWLDARVNGQIRMAVAEYSQEYEPGTAGALFDAPQFKVFKLNRRYASDADRDAALIEYKQMAVPYGAPPVSVLPDGSLSIRGDQMLCATTPTPASTSPAPEARRRSGSKCARPPTPTTVQARSGRSC